MLNETEIKEFQEIYKRQFWEEISKEDAYDQWIKLITLLENVYKPSSKG